MCVVGLYFAFLLLEDLIVGYYTSNFANYTNEIANYTTNVTRTLSQDMSSDLEALYNVFRKETPESKKHVKRSIVQQLTYPNISTTSENQNLQKKRFTQKQYEIINMLWRKTKVIFNDDIQITTERMRNVTKSLAEQMYQEIKAMTFSFFPSSPQTTTPSNIEFYYSDDSPQDDKLSIKSEFNQNVYDKSTSDKPFLIFHIKGPYGKENPKQIVKRSNDTNIGNNPVKFSAIRVNKVKNSLRKLISTPIPIRKENTLADETTHVSYQRSQKKRFFNYNVHWQSTINPIPITKNNKAINKIRSSQQSTANKPTTIYDKIKFFEINDKFTQAVSTVKRNSTEINLYERNLIDINKKILLKHVDFIQDHSDHAEVKHFKKHIADSIRIPKQINNKLLESKLMKHKLPNIESNTTAYFIDEKKKSEANPNGTYLFFNNKTARWSEYSFVAAYIYEPSQVHCDAAVINSYWLIASGSCLSRVSKKTYQTFEAYGEGQSAYVAYCGERWWDPERVSYVKYIVVHPSYHPNDKTRQRLYNIGAIQVINSLTLSCARLTPISLMSHQVAVKPGRSLASAVGWGLNRFVSKYGSSDLPKIPMSVYESVVYFDSCPGNLAYSKAKRLDEGDGVKNVLCLSLPPYFGEKTDPVHGSLLLADGKLIALYLQEERRRSGEQCAQYTGIWRLIPWLSNIAREPQELDTLMFEV